MHRMKIKNFISLSKHSLWKEYVLTAEPGSLGGLIRNSVPISAATITITVLTVIRIIMSGTSMHCYGATGRFLRTFLKTAITGFTVMP